MSVEFVSHLTRSFALSTFPTKVERAKDATAKMGSAVSPSVTCTRNRYTAIAMVLNYQNHALLAIQGIKGKLNPNPETH